MPDELTEFVNGTGSEEMGPAPMDEKSKRAAGKALIKAIESGDGLAVCEAVKAIQAEAY